MATDGQKKWNSWGKKKKQPVDYRYVQRRKHAEDDLVGRLKAAKRGWDMFGKPLPNEERHTRDLHSNKPDVTVQKDD